MPKDDRRPPAFMLYVNDFCSDGIVEAMTTEQVGAYFLLLCKAWSEEPCGSIPDDDRVLARWSRLTPQRWSKCKAAVMLAFKQMADGRWHQKRMKQEYRNMLAYRSGKSLAGKRGAESRWHSQDSAMLSPIANDGSSTSTSISSSISPEVDVEGASNLSFSENARAKANKIAAIIPCTKRSTREMVAKVAILWDDGAICDDAVEQTIESFAVSDKRIANPAGWFYACMVNQCQQRGQNFEQLLKATAVPISVFTPAT